MKKSSAARLALLALVVAGVILVLVNREQLNPARLEAIVADLGFWGPLFYIGLWLVAPALFFPGAPITLAGGALFGPVWGPVYTIVGATGGATVAFLMARYMAGSWVERKSGGRLGRIKDGVEAEGWMFVAFTRLVPLFPFNLLNYAFGLTRIPLKTYVVVSFICMAPGTAGYAYIGFAGREALVGGEDLLKKGIYALAVFAALVFLPIIVRRWRARSRSASGEKS